MRNRDFGFVALGRFLAVEQYYETQLTYSTDPRRTRNPDRNRGRGDQPSRTGPGAPAQARHR
jgi:hypothetical protein